ncbi:MAG TPA: DUF4286 family protein [Chthoniobacterales bacterium]|jgi:hypothetical protein|nr:DUF4286 family protein [Chthoniobacterales bacterium]
MIIYRVDITIQPGIEAEWVDWMKPVHVPDVLRTGCFSDCRIHKVLEAAGDEPIYVMQYHGRSLADYHRYREKFASVLQKEHSDRFAGRFRGSRQILEEIANPAERA